MNYTQFLNKEIINQNNEKGIVVSYDPKYIVIRYQNEDKTYNPDIAFQNKFITFMDGDLNSAIEANLSDKKQAELNEQKMVELNQKQVTMKHKLILQRFHKLHEKKCYLQLFFGRDFRYPPYERLLKKYWWVIGKRL